jgi:hypothetical protein
MQYRGAPPTINQQLNDQQSLLKELSTEANRLSQSGSFSQVSDLQDKFRKCQQAIKSLKTRLL